MSAEPASKKKTKVDYIQNEKELHDLRNYLLRSFANVKIETVVASEEISKADCKEDAEDQKETVANAKDVWEGEMSDDVNIETVAANEEIDTVVASEEFCESQKTDYKDDAEGQKETNSVTSVICSVVSESQKTDCKDDAEGQNETSGNAKDVHVWEGEMFDDVARMQRSMNIKDTEFQSQLIALEKQLISKIAKKHISRQCHAPNCKRVASEPYPDNIYLCDEHKGSLRKQLEEYQIPCDEGSAEEQRKCRQLRGSYQKIIDSLKVADADQSFGGNQHKYPKQYFSVSMSKLILCQQQLAKSLPPNADQQLEDSRRKMKKIVAHLMDLLIVARQNLNCHWCDVCAMIISVCACIGGGVAWVAVNAAYIIVLYTFLGVFVGVMISGAIFGNGRMKFVAGATAVGTVAGFGVGAYAAAAVAIKEGVQLGAVSGTMFGGPGPGTAVGAAIGAVCGGLFAGGCALMYKFRNE